MSSKFRPQDLHPVNQPVDPADALDPSEATYSIDTEHGETLQYLDRAELDEYNRDPDLFAARRLGLADAEEYREWLACGGAALCSERTKSGHLCQLPNCDAPTLYVDEWRRLHRARPCCLHAKNIVPPVSPVSPPRRKYGHSRAAAPDDCRCAALTKLPKHPWDRRRCELHAPWWQRRDGRPVCGQHFSCSTIEYACDGND